VLDAIPRHVGDVQQAVDAAEVDERAEVGDVLDDALADLPMAISARSLALARCSSMSLRREMTMLRRSLSILRILASIVWPMYSPTSAGAADVDLRRGQEHGHADVDQQAALDLAQDAALTMSPSLVLSTMRRQLRMRSARRFETRIIPVSGSMSSTSTCTSPPTCTSDESSHSSSGTMPSLLSPRSRSASLPLSATTFAFRMELKSR
jgi:hypothetical protein